MFNLCSLHLVSATDLPHCRRDLEHFVVALVLHLCWMHRFEKVGLPFCHRLVQVDRQALASLSTVVRQTAP